MDIPAKILNVVIETPPFHSLMFIPKSEVLRDTLLVFKWGG